ncbi:MAG: molybdopterin converting factor subunit 1 [Thermomicrobium sp.]|uniref:molybdopterin converting factor subunit 1 n=1 Tax=Thermomicrobium sp. TaxID=1969469 RepID=UPI001B0AF10E|nr:molybdopterin converting factor subunit 1 [Thermomicrobium sp.]MBO9350063.1 molybdopterin converting factor subunit 1 [Thermomicrobium sp.]
MRVTVRYFAIVRELLGRDREERDLPEGTTVGQLLAQLCESQPSLARLQRSMMVMVNRRYARPDQLLREGDEVALVPPVSGGSTPFSIGPEPLDPRRIEQLVTDPRAGAVVLFIGTVRDHARGKRVLYLEYEAYAEAALETFAQIAEEIRQRWDVLGIAIAHRTGRVDIGEASVVIAVSSAHRAEAFEACRYAIERLKQVAPIWKKEVYEDGEIWIGSEALYQELFARRASEPSAPAE